MTPDIRHIQNPKFYLKSGKLTVYALACGYQEFFETTLNRVRLWYEGGPCFHVRANENDGTRIYWLSTYSIGKARKVFSCVRNMMQENRAISEIAEYMASQEESGI